MGQGRILVVDDEPQIRRVMRITLIADGYEVDDARNGDEALDHIRTAKYDLILLDVNMPGMSGIATCRAIRASSNVPIIMLTVRSDEKDKVAALDSGADDYVTKPFSTPELLARIHSAVRRNFVSTGVRSAYLHLGEIQVDFNTHSVQTPTGELHLTAKEFDLLFYLAQHVNRAIAHRELLRAVWGPDYGDEQEYLRVFVNRLRKKIEHTPAAPKYLLTEPWVGYRLRLPESPAE
jgi:two-component system KDP operon response regulator KdpE